MSENFLENARLNDMQKKAVMQTEGPLLILAGAGSGKTRVLTHRIAHLIKDKNVAPWSILAITFTNKAAKEMKERVCGLCGESGMEVWVATFHSTCVRILRREIEALGYSKEFTILDDDDQDKLLTNIYKQFQIDPKDIPTRETRGKISNCKNSMVSPEEYIRMNQGNFREAKIAQVYGEYEKQTRKDNCLDFDDLILKTIELFRQFPETLDKYANRFRYVHVDEYQDTNHAQYELVRMLSSRWHNVCVVGDDDQSIYGWRGADISNILDFERDYRDAVVIKLEQNYRSTNHILKAANAVIGNNVTRKKKRLWSDKGEGNLIRVEKLGDERGEAAFVAGEIGALVRAGYRYSEIAVLYRLNSQSRVLEEMLLGSGIPYAVYGGQPFYNRKEIRDCVAYLRIITNPGDELALRRILNVPRRAIGDSAVNELERFALSGGDSMLGVVLDCGKYAFSGRCRSKIQAFSQLMDDLIMQSMLQPPVEFISYLLDKTGMRLQYENSREDDAKERLENINELVNAAARYFGDNPEATLSDYLVNIALVSEPEQEDLFGDSRGNVSMMTIHSAKGLEFRAVFLVGAEEGIFPLSRAGESETELEEERRLCYVAITRAMEQLYITYTCSRMHYGEVRPSIRSRFLEEIPAEYTQSLLPEPFRTPRRRQEAWEENDWGAGGWHTRVASAYDKPKPSEQRSSAGMSISAQKSSPARPASFAPGQKVRHKRFGRGTVISSMGKGDDTQVTVAFEGQGVKTLVAIYANLESAED